MGANSKTKISILLLSLGCLGLGIFLGYYGRSVDDVPEQISEISTVSSEQTLNPSENSGQEKSEEISQITSDDYESTQKDEQPLDDNEAQEALTNSSDPPASAENNTTSDADDVTEIPELNAVWVKARSLKTPEKVDQVLAQVEAGQFNTIFALIFYHGHSYYESALLEKEPTLAPDYDPLKYLVEQAHRRDIEVHAWFVTGWVEGSQGGLGPILTQHPDWAMVRPDGVKYPWLNFNRPDVREFIADIVVEVAQNYDIDGIHFDYLRYPDTETGFDPYSAELFAQEYGTDLERLRFAELPAYGTFRGNPLLGAHTAQVLATFDDDQPAIILNNYGAGQVVLFNWDILRRRNVAATGEIMGRSIKYLADADSEVYILRSETNAEKYGFARLNEAITWLNDFGWSPTELAETDIATLNEKAVLVMPNIYLISSQQAADLADFVHQGGGVIFIDGPTPSIDDKNIQAITGMWTRGTYFEKTSVLKAASEHELIPTSNRTSTLEEYQTLDTQWKDFRAQGINKTLQNAYQRLKQENSELIVTITVADSQAYLAQNHLLDWQAWLEGEYVDLIIPRTYMDLDERLSSAIAEWQPVMDSSERIMLGLVSYSEQKGDLKTPDRMLSEIDLSLKSGSKGVALFYIDKIGDDVLDALADGPFSSPSNISN